MDAEWLTVDLAGVMASFGGVAPGARRDTELLPTRSAILGLLAAALGIRRDEADLQRELGVGLLFAARSVAIATLMRDYHTTQAPVQSALKGRPCVTRHDELAVPKDDLNTVLSDRYYSADFSATVGVTSSTTAVLDRLAAALRAPRFTLYLGRKSCPLAWPLVPQRFQALSWKDAMELHDERSSGRLAEFRKFGVERWLRGDDRVDRRDRPIVRYVHRGDFGIAPGVPSDQVRSVTRRDDPIDVSRRTFAERRHWCFEQRNGP